MHWQDGRLPDNEDAHDRRGRGNPPGFTITVGNVLDSKETCSLIQILEAKYLSKAGKHDVEERGQRCFLGDKGYAGSIIERILAVKGRISARPSRKNSKKPQIVDKRIDQERRPVENDFERIKGARALNRIRQNRCDVCRLCDLGLLLRLVKTLG